MLDSALKKMICAFLVAMVGSMAVMAMRTERTNSDSRELEYAQILKKDREMHALMIQLDAEGYRCLMAKDYARAEECFTRIIMEPNCYESFKNTAYFNRGLSKSWRGENQGAYDDWGMAIKLGFSDPVIYQNRGIVLERLGKRDDAGIEFATYNNLKPRP